MASHTRCTSRARERLRDIKEASTVPACPSLKAKKFYQTYVVIA
jgi:hypothetical protein